MVAVEEQSVVNASVGTHASADVVSIRVGRVRRLERWAEDALTWLEERLPARVRRVVPRELLGFAILGGFTFLVDLALLSALRHWTPLPLPVDVSLAYGSAFGINFVLNRTVNFRSHAPVGRQVLKYAVVAASDYLMTLGFTTGLSALGVDFRLARLFAATCVAVFTYSASRWWVFRDTAKPRDAARHRAATP